MWLTESVDRAIRRSLGNTDDIDVTIDYLIQRAMVPEMVVKEFDHAPWVLVHDYLHSGNLIVDDDLHIIGY